MAKNKDKIQAYDGKWYRTRNYISCCDCGLTHRIEYRVKLIDNYAKLYMRAWRDKSRTIKNRKCKKNKLKKLVG